MARENRLTEDELKAILAAEVRDSVGSFESGAEDQLAQDRRRAMEYYLGEPFGNEVDGQSQVVLTEVADTIEWMIPALLDPFVAGENIGEFQPMGPEDEEFAKQATEYVNQVVLRVDNNGFLFLYDLLKDGLLQKLGVVKVYWEEKEVREKKTLTGLPIEQIAMLVQDESLEVTAATEHETPMGVVYDIAFERRKTVGKVRIDPVPPEEFLIARRSVSIVDASFKAHRTTQKAWQLIEMGYDEDVVMKAASSDEHDWNPERVARFSGSDEVGTTSAQIEPLMRDVLVVEAYLNVDWDGDGKAEFRRITALGPGFEIVDNEEVDGDPFCSFCPIPIPHRLFGLSYADITMDLQLIKSTVARQSLDNVYNVNNARTAINERVDIDDMLTRRVAGVVRVTGADAVGDAIHEMATVPIVQHTLPVLEYLDTVKENRTGVTRYNQGIDADSLNKTAHGIERIMSAAQQRTQLIARIFAENTVTPLFRKILKLLIEHQDQPRKYRFSGTGWADIDPRSWNAEMDVRINVGLGYGSKQQKAQLAMGVLQIMGQVTQLLGPAAQQLFGFEEVRNAIADFVEASGRSQPSRYVKDVANAPPMQQPPPPPDPKLVEVQGKQQLAEQEFAHKSQLAEKELGMKAQAQQFDLLMKAWMAENELGFKRQQMAQEGELKREGLQQEIGIKRESAEAERGMKAEQHGFDMGQKRIEAGQAVSEHDPFRALMESVNAQTQALLEVVKGITQSNQALVAAIQQPKEITRDKAGKPTGIRPANGAMH